MARKKSRRNSDHRLVSSRGQASCERADALAKGGQQSVIWRSGGVKRSVTKDRRKEKNRRACRGRVRR